MSIVIDTSAMVAIVFAEPERQDFLDIVIHAQRVLVSTPSVLETRMVVHGRRGERGVILLDDLLRLPLFVQMAPGAAEIQAAYAAFVTYGKGSGHPAGLNFGDVFSYALAKVHGLPLLSKATTSRGRTLPRLSSHLAPESSWRARRRDNLPASSSQGACRHDNPSPSSLRGAQRRGNPVPSIRRASAADFLAVENGWASPSFLPFFE